MESLAREGKHGRGGGGGRGVEGEAVAVEEVEEKPAAADEGGGRETVEDGGEEIFGERLGVGSESDFESGVMQFVRICSVFWDGRTRGIDEL